MKNRINTWKLWIVVLLFTGMHHSSVAAFTLNSNTESEILEKELISNNLRLAFLIGETVTFEKNIKCIKHNSGQRLLLPINTYCADVATAYCERNGYDISTPQGFAIWTAVYLGCVYASPM